MRNRQIRGTRDALKSHIQGPEIRDAINNGRGDMLRWGVQAQNWFWGNLGRDGFGCGVKNVSFEICGRSFFYVVPK